MGYRERIEEAVAKLFEQERRIQKALPEWMESGFFDEVEFDNLRIAFGLLGVPEDTWDDFDIQDEADLEQKSKGNVIYCNDFLCDIWFSAESADEFIKACADHVKWIAEETLRIESEVK
jgi:hypothetical protein